MTIIASLIVIAGNILGLFGFVALLVKVYKKSIFWLIACFLLPPFGIIVFSVLNLKEVWKPWAYIVSGLIIAVLGVQSSPELRKHFEENYSIREPSQNIEMKDLSRRSDQLRSLSLTA